MRPGLTTPVLSPKDFQYELNEFWGKLRSTHLHKDIPFPHRLAKIQCYLAL